MIKVAREEHKDLCVVNWYLLTLPSGGHVSPPFPRPNESASILTCTNQCQWDALWLVVRSLEKCILFSLLVLWAMRRRLPWTSRGSPCGAWRWSQWFRKEKLRDKEKRSLHNIFWPPASSFVWKLPQLYLSQLRQSTIFMLSQLEGCFCLCVCWLSLCPLCRNVYSCLLPIFNWIVCFFLYWIVWIKNSMIILIDAEKSLDKI